MQEIGMLLKWVREQLQELRGDLRVLRAAGDALGVTVARIMGDESRTINYRTESVARLREDACREQAQRLSGRNVAGRLDEVSRRAGKYTRSVAVRQARFTPQCILLASFSDGEKRTIRGLADVAESLERMRWGQDLERMDAQELEATIDVATDAGSLAILGAVIREGRRRMALPGGVEAGAGMLVGKAESVLRAWSIPEIEELEQAFEDCRLVGMWIDEAGTALQTGEDIGRRHERAVEISRARARGEGSPTGYVVDAKTGMLEPAAA